MRLNRLLILLFLLGSFSAYGFELIMIQTVSESKRTFITRNGKRQGLQNGHTGTFTSDDVSVLARVVNATGEFTQWELINKDALLPFEKGAIVTYYPATEYLWALAPEYERRKYIKSEIPKNRTSLIFKGALTKGLSESVSGAVSATPDRGGYLGEIYYEKGLYGGLAFDVGLRYEQEVANYEGFSYSTIRRLAIIDLVYYFDAMREYLSGGRFYLSGGLGYGISATTTTSLSQSGIVALLPVFKGGLTLPFNETWEFMMDSAFESLNSREEQESGTVQTTTQTNFKIGLGLKRYFE